MSARKISSWAMPHVKRFRTYIDIGASVGNTSVPYIDTFQQIIAFEPNPESFEKIKLNEKLVVYKYALSDQEGMSKLIVPQETLNPEHGSIASRRNSEWKGPTFDVETKTLDSFNFTDVDFIKIDVEQGEYEVVMGGMNTILKFKPVVMFENKRNENDPLIEVFASMGYTHEKHKSDTVVYYKE